MSFFLKGQPKSEKRKQFSREKHKTNNKVRKTEKPAKGKDEDEEIDSEEEEEAEQQQNGQNLEFSDDGEEDVQQTAQDKHLRLAKKYLEEIAKEEQNRADDKELHSTISQRLTDEYLDSVGKLRRKIAKDYVGYSAENVIKLKHKLQKLPITCLCLSTDNEFMFTGSKTHLVIKWDMKSNKPVGTIDCTKSKSANMIGYGQTKNKKKTRPQVWSMALTTDFKFLAIAAMDNFIQIWCPQTLKPLHTFQGHRDLVTALVFRKDTHQLYSASRDRSVKIWSLDEMAYIESLFGHQSGVTDIDALSRERAITSGGYDGSIRIWKIIEESQLIYNGHKGNIELVRLINDENFLSAGNDGSLCVWSIMKKKALCTKELCHGKSENGEPNWIISMATLLNTDLAASGSCDGSIKLWKFEDNFRIITSLFTINAIGYVNGLQFFADGSKLIAGIGQEHRLGRWERIKEAKNCSIVIPLERNQNT